jgi:hypothetical protein
VDEQRKYAILCCNDPGRFWADCLDTGLIPTYAAPLNAPQPSPKSVATGASRPEATSTAAEATRMPCNMLCASSRVWRRRFFANHALMSRHESRGAPSLVRHATRSVIHFHKQSNSTRKKKKPGRNARSLSGSAPAGSSPASTAESEKPRHRRCAMSEALTTSPFTAQWPSRRYLLHCSKQSLQDLEMAALNRSNNCLRVVKTEWDEAVA